LERRRTFYLPIDMVCDEDTTANGPAMGGLSRCVLKGTRTVLRGGRGSDAPNLPDLTNFEYRIQSENRKKLPAHKVVFFSNWHFRDDALRRLE